MRIAALLSGGLDSTALCWWLLTQYDYPVHIHHMHLSYVDPDHQESAELGRVEAERVAIGRIVAWLRENCRSFAYSESTAEFCIPGTRIAPIDHYWCAFYGANLITSGIAEVLATGRILTDQNPMGSSTIFKAYELFKYVATVVQPRLWVPPGRKAHEREPVPVPVEWVCPLVEWSKAQILMTIPCELADLTVTCRGPRLVDGEIVLCGGKCRSCRRRIQAESCVEAGMDVETANDWLCRNPPVGGTAAGPKYYPNFRPWPVTIEDIERDETRMMVFRHLATLEECQCAPS